ncbi:MAG TPA: HK97 gp10 family phage protein, partial [Thermoflexales bacterium]|nr:HK97 gp10 family phage protein [Thermoflexales bacterium]
MQIISKSLVSGSQQLEKDLAALAEVAKGEMAKAMLKSGAKVVQKYANKRAPRPEIEVDDVDDAGGMNKSIGIG